MSTESRSRVTQIMERPQITPANSGDPVSAIVRMVENGEEPRRVFAGIVECAAHTPGVEAAALFLPSDRGNGQPELIASSGTHEFTKIIETDEDRNGRAAIQSMASSQHKSVSGSYIYFDVVCLGAPIGSLALVAPNGIEQAANEKMRLLAHHSGVVFERQRLSNTLQHFLDRLQVLNELNQLIASNVGLQRIVKSLARESAFRFAADIALTFLLNEDKNCLEVKGGYGCAPTLVPPQIGVDSGLLGQAMRLGGHISTGDLSKQQGHGLNFLEELGVQSVDVCCLEVRGESLGAILIGYRRHTVLSRNDLTRFEEFCQGAAVAIANARTQERIQSYTERLEELVESRTAELALQTNRAEEANQAKSQFLANMSHELRTPLTAIVGYSSVLVDGVFGPLNEKQKDALNAVARSSDHLKNLIDDVLSLARIESGKEEAEPVPVPAKELLSQSHKLMMQTALSKGVSLVSLALSEEVQQTSLYVDPKHIHQIIINLMSNAVKYTPRGGTVRLDAELSGDKLKISVADTGVGMTKRKLESLFERFERGEDAYSKSQEGTGIGLNLTRRLVELNGGRIGVESEENQGSVFWIMLPTTTEIAITQSTAEQQPVSVRLEGLSTLVLDDSKDTCDVLYHILNSAGAAVQTCHTVREAIKLIEESPPDVILTDLAMPGESGLVLIQHMRNLPDERSRIPIIVLSACAFESDRNAALGAGASLFIPKPFRPNDIVTNVRQVTLANAMR